MALQYSAAALLPWLFCFAIVAPLPFYLSREANASSLVAPASGAADAATAGATTAEPLSPLGAQFSNPAGLAGFTERTMGTGLGLGYGRGEVTSEAIGYNASNEVLVPFIDSFLIVPMDRWTFGIGTMGTSGARFDYGPRPKAGVDDGFFSETGVIGLPISAGYRAMDKLWLGAELIVLYGSTHLRYSQEVAEFPGEPTPFHYSVEGFGVQGMFGVTWKPTDSWSIGLAAKPPGRVWASGDSKLGSGKQDVDLELEIPAEVALGITRALFGRWRVSYSLRFTDTSVFETSWIRYQDTPSANQPFLGGAQDEWRHAIGIEYAWSERLELLGGFAKANSIVGRKGVSPMSYDCKDFRLNTGLHWTGDTWIFDGSFGYIFSGTRNISEDDAKIFPGKFDSKPAYLLSITVSKKF